jgi:hypothetical protein
MKKSFELTHVLTAKRLAELRTRAQTKKPRPPLLSLLFAEAESAGITAEFCASSKTAGEIIVGLLDKDGDCISDPIHTDDILGTFLFEFDGNSFSVTITDTASPPPPRARARVRVAEAPAATPAAATPPPPAPAIAPTPLDPSAVTKYLLRGGSYCPFCRSARLVRTYPSPPNFVDGALDLTTRCEGCQRHWTDRLRIAAVIVG